MTSRQELDRIAVLLSFAEPDDADVLGEVREGLAQFGATASDDGAPEALARACAEGAERLASVIAGNDSDPDAALSFASRVIDFACEVLTALEGGRSAQDVTPPWEADAVASPASGQGVSEARGVDSDLLEMFVSECGETLHALEAQLLELEHEQDPKETIAEIRRRIHTFKGECGVLSLHAAQALCHEAETLIDRSEECGTIPVDLLLDLADWLQGHVLQLKDGSTATTATTAGHAELLQRLQAAGPGGSEQAAADDTSCSAAEVGLRRIEFGPEVLHDEALPAYLETGSAFFEELGVALLELEEAHQDQEVQNRVSWALHEIKEVDTLQLEAIVLLAGKAERLLDELLAGQFLCLQIHIDLLFLTKQALGAMLAALDGGTGPLLGEVDRLLEQLDHAIAGEVHEDLSAASTTASAGILDAIGLHDHYAVDEIIAEPSKLWRKLGEILLQRSELTRDALRDALDRQRADAAAGNSKPIGEMLVELGLITQQALDEALREQEHADHSVADLMRAAVTPEPLRKNTRKVRAEGLVRIGTKRLDELVDMVGELVIAQQMIQQTPSLKGLASETLTRNLGTVAKITRDLQEGAMSLRMVTLKPTFQKMARLVRDVASKSEKQVRLRLRGEDTELDRNVVEHLGDPLVHLIRNSIDHGLESAEDRRAAGKAPNGTLELNAFHQGGSIVIEVRDDGRGLDCDRILAKAIERGLIEAGTTREDLSDEEIHKMIFQAGFSTAAQVSDISGRGVGMDVVRRQVESMRGKVEIESGQGVGTTISLRLPLTLAIIDGMVVRVGRNRYVIPTLSIEQSFRPAPGTLHRVAGEGLVVDVRDELLPAHSIKQVLDLPEGADEAEHGILMLLESNHERACFLVDEILGQQQVVIRSLGKGLPSLPGVSGGAILGDGLVALILDVEGLLARVHCISA